MEFTKQLRKIFDKTTQSSLKGSNRDYMRNLRIFQFESEELF